MIHMTVNYVIGKIRLLKKAGINSNFSMTASRSKPTYRVIALTRFGAKAC